MPTNPYFNNHAQTGEQNLLEDLIVESIKDYGIDLIYIPRTLNALDTILGEDDLSTYKEALPIEMYIKSVDGFGGDGEFLSKFGLEIRDQVTLTVSIKSFKNFIQPSTGFERPREGDLIYFPFNTRLFVIRYVDYKPFFYQLGKLQTWDLICELFEYSSENFNTGIDEIDIIQDQHSLDVYDFAITDEVGNVLTDENGNVLLVEDYTISDQAGNESDNDQIQTETDSIYDWSEIDPFSEGDGTY